jgi:hypothetical protein
MRKLFFANFVVALGIASANTLSLDPVLIFHQYQQTTNSPCVIGDSSCQIGELPDKTVLPPNDNSYDALSPLYTVADIRLAVGDDFFVGFDINQTSVVQTLSLMAILINGSVVDSYTANPATSVPPTTGGGNGNGYADYLFTNVTSLAGLSDTATVQFHLVMPLVNDGREQLFLISEGGGGGGGAVVPEPSTLITAALGGFALLVGYRRRRS